MKWFGIPVEEVTAVINGNRVRIGIVYEWADKSRREVFDVSASEFDEATVRSRPLFDGT